MPDAAPDQPDKRREIPVLIPKLPDADALLPYLRQIDATHWYSNYGPLWRAFREALTGFVAERTQNPAVQLAFTSSGTTAIELALRCTALRHRAFCLMPSFTFIASAHAVVNAGLRPFLADVDESSMLLTPEIARQTLALMPEPPAAVLVISAFGAPPDLAAWQAFQRETGIPVVFDAAAALVSLDAIGEQPVCVSLHATKVLGIGEGGAMLSTNRELVQRITAMTGFGFVGAERISAFAGGNYRISEYTAAVGLAALAAVDGKIRQLRAVVGGYRQTLANSPIRLQQGVGDRWVTMTLNVIVPPHLLHGVLDRFGRQGVQWRRWWGLGCHTHPAFAQAARGALTTTEQLAPRVLGVPCHTELSEAEVQIVCACLLGRDTPEGHAGVQWR